MTPNPSQLSDNFLNSLSDAVPYTGPSTIFTPDYSNPLQEHPNYYGTTEEGDIAFNIFERNKQVLLEYPDGSEKWQNYTSEGDLLNFLISELAIDYTDTDHTEYYEDELSASLATSLEQHAGVTFGDNDGMPGVTGYIAGEVSFLISESEVEFDYPDGSDGIESYVNDEQLLNLFIGIYNKYR